MHSSTASGKDMEAFEVKTRRACDVALQQVSSPPGSAGHERLAKIETTPIRRPGVSHFARDA